MKSSGFLVAGVVVLAACNVQRVQTSRSVALDDHAAHMSAADLAPASGPLRERPTTQQGHPGLPASDSTAAARLRSTPRHGEWVRIALEEGSRDSLMAWVVYPAARTRAPVVVVVHEIYGLTTWVRGVADQVAAEGFIAVAPDFNSRVRGGPSTVELTRDSASRIIRGVDAAERNRIIVAAANYGMTQPSAEQKYAVIGYCWGGGTVFNHAVHGGVRGYSGGVAYYGISYLTAGQRATATSSAVPGSFMVDSLARIEKPLMLLNGSLDMRIAAAMPALDSIMKRLKKDYTGINYDGAIHGFLRAQDDPRPVRGEVRNQQDVVTRPAESEAAVNAERAANLAAARDAWPKTVAFLRRTLR
jgi:carboxymethylenebutenolidase